MAEAMNIQDARIARQPSAKDPQEIALRERLDNLLITEWARKTITRIRRAQEEFLRWVIASLKAPETIRSRYEQLLRETADLIKAHIVSGEEHLVELANAKGVIVVTNHLGTAKLTRIDNINRHLPVDLDTIEPFPIRPASLVRIADKLNAPLYETAIELPSPLLEAQKASDIITVAPEGAMRALKLLKDVQGVIKQNPGAVIIMYPEAGTSGKRNVSEPYNLDEFRRGAFFIAAQAKLPILAVCQYFNPDLGMELHILKPVLLTSDSPERIREATEQTKAAMQAKLNELSYSK